jgi:hypothetical protein
MSKLIFLRLFSHPFVLASDPRSAYDPSRIDGATLAGPGQFAQLPTRHGCGDGRGRHVLALSVPPLSAPLSTGKFSTVQKFGDLPSNRSEIQGDRSPVAPKPVCPPAHPPGRVAQCVAGRHRGAPAPLWPQLGIGRVDQHAPDEFNVGDRCRSDRLQDGARYDVLFGKLWR